MAKMKRYSPRALSHDEILENSGWNGKSVPSELLRKGLVMRHGDDKSTWRYFITEKGLRKLEEYYLPR